MLELTGDAMILLLRLVLVGLLYLFLGSIALAAARELRKLAQAASPARPTQPAARLIVVDPGATSYTPGETLPLRSITRLGRAADSTIILDDTFISAEHAVIVQRDGGWWIADRGSTNGTSVNDQRVHGEAALKPGDLVAIGDVRLRVAL
jgi:pSer/pThr/pTyr-binding forkhead associated (FHA) protein